MRHDGELCLSEASLVLARSCHASPRAGPQQLGVRTPDGLASDGGPRSGPGKPRVRVDVSAGVALPLSQRYFSAYYKKGPELVAGVRYRLSPILDLRVSAEAILVEHTPEGFGGPSNWLRRVDPLLAFLAGPRVALSTASTHMYLQGSVGVVPPTEFGPLAPALGVGVGIRHLRGFGEITYTHGFEGYAGQDIGYASLRLGVSLGPR